MTRGRLRACVGSILFAAVNGLNHLRMSYWRLRLAHLGAGALIYPRAAIYSPRFVRIGCNVSINDFVHIRGAGGVEIGNDTLIAPHVVITSQSHDIGALSSGLLYRQTQVAELIQIGSNVWIGAGAIILPGVIIGDGAVVAAGALVSANVPAATLVAGVPARVLRVLAAR